MCVQQGAGETISKAEGLRKLGHPRRAFSASASRSPLRRAARPAAGPAHGMDMVKHTLSTNAPSAGPGYGADYFAEVRGWGRTCCTQVVI